MAAIYYEVVSAWQAQVKLWLGPWKHTLIEDLPIEKQLLPWAFHHGTFLVWGFEAPNGNVLAENSLPIIVAGHIQI